MGSLLMWFQKHPNDGSMINILFNYYFQSNQTKKPWFIYSLKLYKLWVSLSYQILISDGFCDLDYIMIQLLLYYSIWSNPSFMYINWLWIMDNW